MAKSKRDIFNSWKTAIKKDIQLLVKKSGFDLASIQNQTQTLVDNAERMIADKNLDKIIKKLKDEHTKLIKSVELVIKAETKKANKLLGEQKKKLKKLQEKFEKEFSIFISAIPKKTTRKKTSRKKTSSRKKTTRKKTASQKKAAPTAKGKTT